MTRPALLPSPSAASAAPSTLWEGYGYGFLGVLVFSLTLPMTRVAVAELAPLLVGLGRALIAALPAVALLWLTRSRRPNRAEWPGVILAALGIVVGWPLASSIAMQTVPSSQGAVFNGLLPLSTAAFAALRSGERPSAAFWGWAVAGAQPRGWNAPPSAARASAASSNIIAPPYRSRQACRSPLILL